MRAFLGMGIWGRCDLLSMEDSVCTYSHGYRVCEYLRVRCHMRGTLRLRLSLSLGLTTFLRFQNLRNF